MIESEAPQEGSEEEAEDIETGDETSDFGDRPESPESGHPVEETEPEGGMPDQGHEHPDDTGTGREGTTSP